MQTCLKLLNWLGIASSRPSGKEARALLPLKQAEHMADTLFRIGQVPREGGEHLAMVARQMALPHEELPPGAAAQVDVDELLLEWMGEWGRWDPLLADPSSFSAAEAIMHSLPQRSSVW